MVLPANVCREIQAMPRACVVNEEDKLIWAASPNGDFNLNSAYSPANGEGHQCFNGKWIWKTPVLPRIQFFLWMCCHNSLATRERFAGRTWEWMILGLIFVLQTLMLGWRKIAGRSDLPVISKFLGTFSSPLVFGSCGIIAIGWCLRTLP